MQQKKEGIKKTVTIKEPLFIKSFRLAKSNPGKTGYIVLFDFLFLVTIYVLQALSQYAANSMITAPTLSTFYIFLLFSVIYYLIVIFAYSFFKYAVLDYVKSLFDMSEIHRISERTRKSLISDETEFSFRRLGQFYSLNVVIAGIFFAVIILGNFVLAGIKIQYRPYIFIAMAVPCLLLLYVLLNTLHSLFYQGASFKDSLKKSFKITFTKIKAYRETIPIMILSALVLWLLFFGSGYLIRLLASKSYILYLTYYAYFKQASTVIFDIVFYAVILINRISFYSITKNEEK